jgi:hypothetical protein
MSSLYARSLLETWLKDPAMTVPFFGTINETVSTTPNIWCTASFGSTYREVLAFCDGVEREEGELEIIYFGPPGEGYQALLQAIETDMLTLMAQRDPNNKLVLTGRSAPFEYTGGDAEQEYSCSVYVDFSYYV